jgi:hypothetical protein
MDLVALNVLCSIKILPIKGGSDLLCKLEASKDSILCSSHLTYTSNSAKKQFLTGPAKDMSFLPEKAEATSDKSL